MSQNKSSPKPISCDASIWHPLLFLPRELKNSLSTTEQVRLGWFIGTKLSSQHWFCIQPCKLKLLTMCCWLQAHSLAGHFVHWKEGLAMQRQQRCCCCLQYVATQSLPASLLSAFHYSLFNLFPWRTAAQSRAVSFVPSKCMPTCFFFVCLFCLVFLLAEEV